MHPFLPRRRFLSAGLGSACLLFGSSSGCSASYPEPIKFATNPWPGYDPLYVARDKGYFRDEGLDVEIVDFPGGAKALQALIGGSADVVSGSFEHTIVMQTLAQKIQTFVLQGTNPGLELGIVRARQAAYTCACPPMTTGW